MDNIIKKFSELTNNRACSRDVINPLAIGERRYRGVGVIKFFRVRGHEVPGGSLKKVGLTLQYFRGEFITLLLHYFKFRQ